MGKKFNIGFFVLILFFYMVAMAKITYAPWCDKDKTDCGECGGSGWCTCGSCDRGGCTPSVACSNLECGHDSCGTGCTDQCKQDPFYNQVCTSNKCQFYPASLTAGVNKLCINNLVGSRTFSVSGKDNYCGNLTIVTSWGSQKKISSKDESFNYNTYITIPINVINTHMLTGTPITVEVRGDRETVKSVRDTDSYSAACTKSMALAVTYDNFYYCPTFGESISSDFDYYPQLISGSPSGYYFFYNDNVGRDWDECYSVQPMESCSLKATDCVTESYLAQPDNINSHGAEWVHDGYITGAYFFNGTGAYLELLESNGNFERTNKFSIGLWYRGTASDGAVFSKMNANNNMRGYDLFIQGGKLSTHLANTWPSDGIGKLGATSINDNLWHYLAMTYDGSSTHAGINLYVDGKAETATNLGSGLSSSIINSVSLKLGARSAGAAGAADFVSGRIDELKIYDYALTPREVCNNAGKTFSSGVCA